MAILVVTATDAERAGVPEAAERLRVLVCGVGKTGAAAAVVAELLGSGAALPEAVVSFGIAGAYPGSGLAPGDVVVATETAVLDEGLETGDAFRPFVRRGMRVPGAVWTATDPGLVDRLASRPQPGFAVATGRIATVSVCAGSARLAEERARTGAIAESMEGAAVAEAVETVRRVLLRSSGVAVPVLPFVEIRGISNPCGPRDGAPFELAGPVAHAGEVLRRLLVP